MPTTAPSGQSIDEAPEGFKPEMRLLVCGGRYFSDVPRIWAILDQIHNRRMREHGDGVAILIDGAQKYRKPDRSIVGADYWAHQWALARGIPTVRFPADWSKHGNAAGPIRNRQMLREGRPTHGLAMPGGSGTYDMTTVMSAAGVKVRVEK